MARFVILPLIVAALCGAAPAAEAQQADTRPHVVLIVIDTLRADHLRCYGYSRATSPEIDRLAAEGVIFRKSFSPATWTVPAVMSVFTGLMPSAHGCTKQDASLPKAVPTLAEQFAAKGYACYGVVSNPCLSGKLGFSRGFARYDDYTVASKMEPKLSAAAGEATGQQVTSQALALLEESLRGQKPVFLLVHYMDPHDDYVPPPPYNRKFDPDYAGEIDGRKVGLWHSDPPPARDLAHLEALYDGEIAFTDQQVAKLRKQIAISLPPEKTLTILISDHGEAFAEHGVLQHGNAPYTEEIAVPMIWHWPGRFTHRKIDSPVSTLDIAPTLRELLDFGDMDLLQGKSLMLGLSSGELSRDRVVVSERASGGGQHVSAIRLERRMHWVLAAGKESAGRYELYDLSKDAREARNIYDASAGDELSRLMEASLKQSREINTSIARSPSTNAVKLSDGERRRLEALGYINK